MTPGPSRQHRYEWPASRPCARPGCRADATVTLRFGSTRREAFLVDIDLTASRSQGDLCVDHAQAFPLPRGWTVDDRRGAPEPAHAASTARPWVAPPATEPARSAVAVLEPSSEPDPAPETEVEVELPAEIAGDVEVEGDAPADSEELDQILDARTPLLKRAFGNVRLD